MPAEDLQKPPGLPSQGVNAGVNLDMDSWFEIANLSCDADMLAQMSRVAEQSNAQFDMGAFDFYTPTAS